MLDVSNVKITRSKKRTISLRILPGGIIEVRAPLHAPESFINDFIKRNNDWIEERLGKFTTLVKNYTDGEMFMFLGKEYSLKVGDYTQIRIEGNYILFPRALLFRAKKEIESWYVKQAREFIKDQVNFYAKQMGTSYASISFSDTKSKWGSCTHDNRLQFSWRLIMAPLLVLRYVVIHELAHTTHKNHTFHFWNRVRAFNPSYKQQVKWLKSHGHGLIT